MTSRRFFTTALIWMTVAGAGPTTTSAQQTPTPFGAVVDVARILTEVRVVDLDGNPVLGLTPRDFRVVVDGQLAEVESALWIPSTAEAAKTTSRSGIGAQTTGISAQAPEGRSIVILFQTDFGLEPSRTIGVMRMAPRAAAFVASLGPDDRVALLTYGSHLELLSDFTSDHEAVADMLTTSKILEAEISPPQQIPPLLGKHLDAEEAMAAAQMIDGFELIGRALQEIPGTKSLVYFGYALGRDSTGPGIAVGKRYERAMEALSAARTSVFSLDITDADYHTLGVGLMLLSEDTGGFFVKTHEFPDVAMNRLARVISSYYELSTIPPPDVGDRFKIKVKVDRPGVRVYVRQYHPSEYE